MKKYVGILLSMILTFTLISCSSGRTPSDGTVSLPESEENTEGTVGLVESDKPIPDDPDPEMISHLLPPISGRGNYHQTHLEVQIPTEMTVSGNSDDVMPVWYYRLGNGTGGPLVEFTDEDIESIKTRMRDVVSLFYGEETGNGLELEETATSYFGQPFTFASDFRDENGTKLSASAAAGRVTLEFPVEKLRISSVDDLLENEIVSTAVKFLGLNDPIVTFTRNSDMAEYTIMEKDKVLSGEGRVKSLTVELFGDGLTPLVTLQDVEMTEKTGDYKAITFSDAENYAVEYFRRETGEPLGSPYAILLLESAYYRTEDDYYGKIYYLPVYRFFVEGFENDPDRIASVDIIAVDFDPASK